MNLQVCLRVLVLLLIEQTDMKRRRGKEENRRAEAQGNKERKRGVLQARGHTFVEIGFL